MSRQNSDDQPATAEQEELRVCRQQRDEYLSGWQRAKADYINYKNEEARRLEDTARYVISSMITDILPVLDSFDLAAQSVTHRNGGEPGEEHGLLLIRSQMLDILRKRGVDQMAVSPGDIFDPAKHEALGEVTSEVAHGSIADEVQKGYTLQGRVIRPARVRLSKGV